MIHRFKRDAAEELLAAVRYYEAQRTGLGGEFLNEVDQAIAIVREAPLRWPTLFDNVRRYRLHRFPYNLVYQVKDTCVAIIAVAHLHREPGYWQRRV